MSAPFQFNTTERNIPYILFYDNGDQVVPTHWHRELELAFTLKGETRLLCNDEMYELGEGEAVLINGGDTHFYFTSAEHRRIVIIFSLDIIDGTSNSMNDKKALAYRLGENAKSSSEWTVSDKEELRRIMHRLEDLNHRDVFGRDLLVRALVFEILCMFAKDEYGRGSNANYHSENKAMDKLQRIFYYIERNYMHPITLADIADEAGFDPSYFTRFFRAYTNVTFHDYLTNYRVSKAQYILINQPDRPIGFVAEDAGFTSIKTFNRAFLQVSGMSPSKFRKVNL